MQYRSTTTRHVPDAKVLGAGDKTSDLDLFVTRYVLLVFRFCYFSAVLFCQQILSFYFRNGTYRIFSDLLYFRLDFLYYRNGKKSQTQSHDKILREIDG